MTTATIERTDVMTAARVERTVTPFERPAERKGSGTVVLNLTSEAAFGSIVLRALETTGPATPRELARETGVSELIIRSVLQALTAVECLDFERGSGRYSLYCEWPRRGA